LPHHVQQQHDSPPFVSSRWSHGFV
jgi:hypothetical protein